MARFAEDAPYKLSRAALRQQYGARAITSGGQSSKDYTPSGRQAYLEQSGKSPTEAAAQIQQEFKSQFPKPAIEPAPAPNLQVSRPSPKQPFANGLASPEDVGILQQQRASGVVRTPYGTVTLGLLPEMGEDMTSDLTSPNPLNNFSLPKFKTTFLGQPLNKRYG